MACKQASLLLQAGCSASAQRHDVVLLYAASPDRHVCMVILAANYLRCYCQGARNKPTFRASAKSSRILAAPLPTYISTNSDADTAMNGMPASPATALAAKKHRTA